MTPPRPFTLLGPIMSVEVIAVGTAIRQIGQLERLYGRGRWRKLKGVALIERGGFAGLAELHWYEAHGIGKKRMKIKRFPL